MRYRGFRLIEALVVIAVLAILFAIFFPVLARSREVDRQNPCMNNQRQIVIAISMYAQDNGELFIPDPKTHAWSVVLKKYKSEDIRDRLMDCPVLSGRGTYDKPEYGFNANLFGQLLGDVEKPAATILTADLGRAGSTGSYAVTATDPAAASYYDKVLDPRHMHGTELVYSAVDGHVGLLPVPIGTHITDAVKKAGLRFDVKPKTP
jgi:type II secretory pathway pseudopilin PulG